MKKPLFFVVLLALAAGAYYYVKSKKDGPTGALVQAAAAVRAHDVASFEKFVDVGSVTSHLVDNVASQGSLLTALVPGGSLMMGGALRLLKPTLASAARQEVMRYVETGSVAAAAPKHGMNLSILGLAGKVVGPDSKFSSIKYATEQGEQALVGIEFTQPRYDTTLVVEVKMLHLGDHWQMTEITNTGDLLRRTANLEKRRMLR
ncbi:hypothetical protein [Hymenobacter coccineus]|uniref:DUF2939 domain-containing protein n=1 Tax=Hymenobacter coccineus TaxID=1908235 RepID=A0A1G1TDM0_9BACT|nr:hypothetical protein [Hymenobacter coccineus]OGX88966.1 hypothetical protein BEN49_09905 [Hymenobacter coccineus]